MELLLILSLVLVGSLVESALVMGFAAYSMSKEETEDNSELDSRYARLAEEFETPVT